MNAKGTMERLQYMQVQLHSTITEVNQLIKELSPEYIKERQHQKLKEYNFIIEFINTNGQEWNEPIQRIFYNDTYDEREGLNVSKYLKSLDIKVEYIHKDNDTWSTLIINKEQIQQLINDLENKLKGSNNTNV